MQKKIEGLDASVEWSADYGVPRRIFDIKPDVGKALLAAVDEPAEPRKVAESFLMDIAGDLDISVDPANLRFESVTNSILGDHVHFQQYHEGKPVAAAEVRVDLDRNNRVYNVQNDSVPLSVVHKGAAKTGPGPARLPDRAIELALEQSGANRSEVQEVLSSELVYFAAGSRPRLAWRIVLRASGPAQEWLFHVDAEDGTVLEQIDLLKRVTGKATVFDPNPVVTLDDTTLRDGSAIPDGAYRTVDLPDLDGTGYLDGKYVSTRRTRNRVRRPDHTFEVKRDGAGFKEAMVYYHIDRVQRYIQQLGFTNVLNGPIEVDVDGETADNSYYSPLTKSLTFGTGGVDDAEDADIILHEYGHAIQDAQVPNFGASRECKAMGEGFGDYLAATFFERVKAANLKPCVGTWDGVSYGKGDPRCLRRLDSAKKYPHDLVQEEHDDGEIWSACLWELRAAIADPQIADRLVLAHHFLLMSHASFSDGANALITADKNLNEGKHKAAIVDVFRRRGILPA